MYKIKAPHVDTLKRFLKSPSKNKNCSDSGASWTVNEKDMRIICEALHRNLVLRNKSILAAIGRQEVSKTIRNEILKIVVASARAPTRMPLITSRHRTSRMEWARNYLQMDMSRVLFTSDVTIPDHFADADTDTPYFTYLGK